MVDVLEIKRRNRENPSTRLGVVKNDKFLFPALQFLLNYMAGLSVEILCTEDIPEILTKNFRQEALQSA